MVDYYFNQKKNRIFKNNKFNSLFNSTPNNFKENSNKTSFLNITIRNVDNLNIKLNLYINQTKHNNIIFSDYYRSKSYYDKMHIYIFDYYLNNNIKPPFYMINDESNFYKSLLKENKTKNMILYQKENLTNFYQNLYEFLKDAKNYYN